MWALRSNHLPIRTRIRICVHVCVNVRVSIHVRMYIRIRVAAFTDARLVLTLLSGLYGHFERWVWGSAVGNTYSGW